MAISALLLTAVVVYLGRSGYSDSVDGELTFLDAVFYATASLSTTGYGVISPTTPTARLTDIVVVTPLRVVFLVLLVGTTLSALTETSRQVTRIGRWRRRAIGHTVVVGYGTKGRAAVDAIVIDNPDAQVVVVDCDAHAVGAAAARGLTTVSGSAAHRDVLATAAISRAATIIVAVDRDDTCVLVTLTARRAAPTVRIVAAARESSSAHVLSRCGADTVVISEETAGRLLGVATTSPIVVDTVDDLLSRDRGLAITERPIRVSEIGRPAADCEDLVLGVVRDGNTHRLAMPTSMPDSRDILRRGDRLLYVRTTPQAPPHLG